MNQLMIMAVFAALLPVGLLLYFIYSQDKKNPEPPRWLWRGVLYGVLSVFVSLSITSAFSGIAVEFSFLKGTAFGAVLDALFNAALPEEAAKLFMIWLLLRNNPYFDEKIDGIVYATCVGLGFAGIENILYLANNLDNLVQVAVTRALFSVPGHFFFAVTMGYYISLSCFSSCSAEQRKNYRLLAYFIPVLLHWAFDAILMVSDAVPYISGALTVVFIVFVIFVKNQATAKIQNLKA